MNITPTKITKLIHDKNKKQSAKRLRHVPRRKMKQGQSRHKYRPVNLANSTLKRYKDWFGNAVKEPVAVSRRRRSGGQSGGGFGFKRGIRKLTQGKDFEEKEQLREKEKAEAAKAAATKKEEADKLLIQKRQEEDAAHAKLQAEHQAKLDAGTATLSDRARMTAANASHSATLAGRSLYGTPKPVTEEHKEEDAHNSAVHAPNLEEEHTEGAAHDPAEHAQTPSGSGTSEEHTEGGTHDPAVHAQTPSGPEDPSHNNNTLSGVTTALGSIASGSSSGFVSGSGSGFGSGSVLGLESGLESGLKPVYQAPYQGTVTHINGQGVRLENREEDGLHASEHNTIKSNSNTQSNDELKDVLNKVLIEMHDMSNSAKIIADVLTGGGAGGSRYIPPANATLINSTGTPENKSDEEQQETNEDQQETNEANVIPSAPINKTP